MSIAGVGGAPHLRPVDLDGDDDLLRPVAPDEVLWRVVARGDEERAA